jgi:NitT/TauT family transport system permease protein
MLMESLLVTLKITFLAFVLAVILGVAIAFVFVQSRFIEVSLFPYAIILQVTPIVAMAPLIIIWVKDTTAALTVCATIMALFPIISNTTLGLRSVNRACSTCSGSTRPRAGRPCAPAHPSACLFLRRPAHFQRAGADRRGGGRVRGRHRRHRLGAGLPDPAGGFPAQHPASVCGLLLITLTGILLFWLMSALSRAMLAGWHESEMA